MAQNRLRMISGFEYGAIKSGFIVKYRHNLCGVIDGFLDKL
jgi:hypothetical protein